MDTHHGWIASYKPIIIGFILSLLMTFAAYDVVVKHHLKGEVLLFSVMGFGLLQVIFQLIFFMQVGLESSPRWNLWMFFVSLIIITIIVIGLLWIMVNINANAMPDMASLGET